MSNEEKADELMEKADKKLKGFSLFGGTGKWEDASEMYTKAANLYKMAKKWDRAGEAYSKAAECHLKLQSKHEAASNYINASNCYKKSNITEAVQCMKQAIEFYTDEGRFSIAAKHQKELAELYESEADLENAISAYQLSADYYEGEGSSSSANACLLKVALFSAQLERYDKAIELYEQVAAASIDNNLLKWSVKEYFLRAGLCHLAKGDIVSAERALERYKDMDATFSSQRECKFLQELVEACKNYDVEAFTNAVVEFDSISKLDSWKTSILLKIKNSIKEEDQLT
jgi:alpha-soluble NSF attachment protein